MDSDSPNALGDDGAAPPDRQDDAAADQADQAQQAEQAEPSPRTPDSYAKPELDQLYREGGLTDPELVERRERLTQSETDRATNDRRVLAQLQVQESRQAQQLAEAEATFATNLEENLSRMRSGADEASVRELVARYRQISGSGSGNPHRSDRAQRHRRVFAGLWRYAGQSSNSR